MYLPKDYVYNMHNKNSALLVMCTKYAKVLKLKKPTLKMLCKCNKINYVYFPTILNLN